MINTLKLENISWLTPDNNEIIKNISLTIPDGKIVAITGPNGSGKTTLAKIIAGIATPTSGKIILDDDDITNFDVTQRAKKGVSFAFQQPVRFKGITVKELLEISSQHSMRENELCDILSTVGLCARQYINREINSTLSGGEIKRIEIASVLARHTKLTIFDEPEAGIDLWSFQNLIGVFKEMHDNLKGTIVIISHQERILKIADEVIVLSNGVIKDSGSADEMLKLMLNEEQISNNHCCKGV